MTSIHSPRLGIIVLSCSAMLIAGCTRVPLQYVIFPNAYERQYDAYDQRDATQTDVTGNLAADGRRAELISAFFGLDEALPGISNRFVCDGAGNADGMPVIFSHEVDPETLEPGDFRVTTASGAVGEVTCLTLAPADDPGELRTALLAGHYGSLEDQPVRVDIVGNVLTLDNTANFVGAAIDVTPLEVGPSLVWAEVVPTERWRLGMAATALPFGGGSGCPVNTQQVVLATWNGGVTKPGGAPADEAERRLYRVGIQRDDGRRETITPFALADLKDGDNNHALCLDTPDPAISVFFPGGHLTDPREDLNADTTTEILISD